MLTDQDLAYTRQTQGLTLVERAIVEHRTTEDDGMGGTTETTVYTADVPCRVAPMRVQAAENIIGGQLQGGLPWQVTLPAGTIVDVSDRVNVGGVYDGVSTVADGRWFEVIAIYGEWTSITAKQCLCMER